MNYDSQEILTIEYPLPLEKKIYDLVVFREFELTNIDKVIIGFVHLHGDKLSLEQLAKCLGFSTVDNFEDEPYTYKDPSEISILNSLLTDIENHNLLELKGNSICLTGLGLEALETSKKKVFKKAQFEVYSFGSVISGTLSVDLIVSLKINSKLTETKEVRWKESGKGFDQIDTTLANQFDHFFGSEMAIHQFDSNCHYSPFDEKLTFLTDTLHTSFLEVLDEGKQLHELCEILNLTSNTYFRTLVIDLAVLRDKEKNPDYRFNAADLEKSWHDMAFDKYPTEKIKWDDDVLKFFKNNADADAWTNITSKIPAKRLEETVEELLEFWDWEILSNRLPDEFILDHINDEGYHWDFSVLSQKNGDIVVKLIHTIHARGTPELNSYWELSERIDTIPDESILILMTSGCQIDPALLSKRSNFLILKILEQCEGVILYGFDWIWITCNWSIDNLWENAELLQDYLDWYELLLRIFKEEELKSRFKNNLRFWEILDNVELHTPFTDEDLLWDEELIELFEQRNMLRWDSTKLQTGFDCNPHVDWNTSTFAKYKHKIKSRAASRYHSSKLQDLDWIEHFADFNWDWDILSKKELIINDLSQIDAFSLKLNWRLLSEYVADSILAETVQSYPWDYYVLSRRQGSIIETLIRKNPTLLWDWKYLAGILSIETLYEILPVINRKYAALNPPQIREFFKSITEKLPIDYLLDSCENYLFEWNWHYITTQINRDIILNRLQELAPKLDWHYISVEMLSPSEVREFISELYEYLDWEHILARGDFDTDLLNNELFVSVLMVLSSITDSENRQRSVKAITVSVDRIARSINDFSFLTTTIDSSLKSGYQLDWSYLSGIDIDYTVRLVTSYKTYWDWDILSRNTSINSRQEYLNKFAEKWNWHYLSLTSGLFKTDFNNKSGKDRTLNLIAALKPFEAVLDWKAFSTRKDVEFTAQLIGSFASCNWDYQALSTSERLAVDERFILQFRKRDWDWNALSSYEGFNFKQLEYDRIISLFADYQWNYSTLSRRKDFEVSVDFISVLKDLDWDFFYLTQNFVRDEIPQLVDLTSEKNLDWRWICNNVTSINGEFLTLYSSKIHWDLLSLNTGIEINLSILKRHSSDWNFCYLTRHPSISNNLNWLFEFPEKKWDWPLLSKNIHLSKHLEIVRKFRFQLDWTAISQNAEVEEIKSTLNEFKNLWDYNQLLANYNVERNLDLVNQINSLITSNPQIDFCRRILSENSQWAGYIYHFTHLTNALDILESKKILSRNEAIKKGFADAAGSVVNRTHNAHRFARFYFRPQTPTQYYNEFLGLDIKSKNYEQARKLNFPRCPVPIFFRFDLKEVLAKYYEKIWVSDGNMQTNVATFGMLGQMIKKFHFADLFSTIEDTSDGDWKTYFKRSQQEFLVQEYLDFSELDSTRIIVPDKMTFDRLSRQISDPALREKMVIDNRDFGVYSFANNKIEIERYKNEFTVSTEFDDRHTLVVRIGTENYTASGNVIYNAGGEVKGSNSISIEFHEPAPFSVFFKDYQNREWEVYRE